MRLQRGGLIDKMLYVRVHPGSIAAKQEALLNMGR
jgi:hypothetical protein